MSTNVYDRDLYPDIWEKDKIAEELHKQAYSVQRQIDNECDKIEVHLFGVELHLEYDEETFTIIA